MPKWCFFLNILKTIVYLKPDECQALIEETPKSHCLGMTLINGGFRNQVSLHININYHNYIYYCVKYANIQACGRHCVITMGCTQKGKHKKHLYLINFLAGLSDYKETTGTRTYTWMLVEKYTYRVSSPAP